MHPGYLWYWKQRQRRGGSCGPTYASAWCETGSQRSSPDWTFQASSWASGDSIFGSGGFGIRRPLRFLTERLDLTERQVSQLARIVERIRIERSQAAVDLRRAAGQLADALEGGDFVMDTALAAGQRRPEGQEMA